MPAKGTRTVKRLCLCGCGQFVVPFLHPNGQVNTYPKYISGHGRKAWGKEWSRRLKSDPVTRARFKPAGSRRIRYDGYVHVKTEDGQWKYEHRVVTEAPEGMIVHHINGNPRDNRPENLSVITQAKHIDEHHALHGRWSIKFTECVRCGKTDAKHISRGLCSSCYQAQWRETHPQYHRHRGRQWNVICPTCGGHKSNGYARQCKKCFSLS